ncbi:hypothetical protein [Persephonella sp.]
MENLWSQQTEIEFFKKELEKNNPENLFYKIDDKYYAYYPKSYKSKDKKETLQSRNALIGEYTESFCKNLLNEFAQKHNLYAVNKVICEDLELAKKSPADLVLCTTPEKYQKPENIKIIFEIKMSIVNNYEYDPKAEEIKFIGDYTTHIGNSSLLRSDSMLKAIGKALNVRISSEYAAKIPIIVLGNTSIAPSYMEKVDKLKEKGFIQGFWSIYPETSINLEKTPKEGFITIKSREDLYSKLEEMLKMDLQFVSFMLDKNKLGEFIEIASKEDNLIDKANRFLQLIRGI